MGAKSHNYPLTLFGMHHHWLDIRNWARGIWLSSWNSNQPQLFASAFARFNIPYRCQRWSQVSTVNGGLFFSWGWNFALRNDGGGIAFPLRGNFRRIKVNSPASSWLYTSFRKQWENGHLRAPKFTDIITHHQFFYVVFWRRTCSRREWALENYFQWWMLSLIFVDTHFCGWFKNNSNYSHFFVKWYHFL